MPRLELIYFASFPVPPTNLAAYQPTAVAADDRAQVLLAALRRLMRRTPSPQFCRMRPQPLLYRYLRTGAVTEVWHNALVLYGWFGPVGGRRS